MNAGRTSESSGKLTVLQYPELRYMSLLMLFELSSGPHKDTSTS